jgi:hypothetical protein
MTKEARFEIANVFAQGQLDYSLFRGGEEKGKTGTINWFAPL